MLIVADENIPLVEQYFSSYGSIIAKPGRDINHDDLVNADILLVRAVTKVDQQLLENTAVKFVGSVTSGFDHLDTDWLDQAGIAWNIAAGCNAMAVAEYIVCTIARLQKNDFLREEKLRAAVIGVGHVGKQVAKKLQALGFEVVLCDPLRAETETNFTSTPLEQLANVDLITLHVPLTTKGRYPTHHFITQEFLQRQKNNCILINTSRGEVIYSNDLKLYGEQLIWCLDVYENEPFIDMELWQPALISTPHIAGYSVQSKFRGVEMIYQAACQRKIIHSKNPHKMDYQSTELALVKTDVDWQDVVLKIYDPLVTSDEMKKSLMEDESAFDALRKNFQKRNEFSFVKLTDVALSEKELSTLKQLGLGGC